MLFSAIEPTLYERMGFRVCDACDWWCDQLEEFVGSGPQATLLPADPRRASETLVDLYQRIHRGTLHLHRDAGSHAESLLENPSDIFLFIEQPARGYVRLNRQGEGLDIVEAVIANEDRAPVLRACAALAKELGIPTWYVSSSRPSCPPKVRPTSSRA